MRLLSCAELVGGRGALRCFWITTTHASFRSLATDPRMHAICTTQAADSRNPCPPHPPHMQARPVVARAAAPRSRASSVHVLAHGAVGATELKKQGFIGEMRAVAMKLHTRDQAPKEGKQEAQRPMSAVSTVACMQHAVAIAQI